MKADLHVHSIYSWDSQVRIEDYITQAEELGLGAIAITDHNSTESHEQIKKLQETTQVILIPGQEVTTLDGHLLIYGFIPTIEKGLTMKESVKRARAHSKAIIAIAAHPFDRFRGGTGMKALESGVDGLEILNASALFSRPNTLAKKNAPDNFIKLGNSDCHLLEELGVAYNEIPNAKNFEEVLQNLNLAVASGKRIGLKRKVNRFVRRKWGRST